MTKSKAKKSGRKHGNAVVDVDVYCYLCTEQGDLTVDSSLGIIHRTTRRPAMGFLFGSMGNATLLSSPA